MILPTFLLGSLLVLKPPSAPGIDAVMKLQAMDRYHVVSIAEDRMADRRDVPPRIIRRIRFCNVRNVVLIWEYPDGLPSPGIASQVDLLEAIEAAHWEAMKADGRDVPAGEVIVVGPERRSGQ